MKLISWNVNGIRAVLKKEFHQFVAEYKPDILCLQETKAEPALFELELEGYKFYWNWPPEKPWYSGTAVMTKPTPLKVTTGITIVKHDSEGRVITAEYPDYYLVNVYVPNSKRDLSRLKYRAEEWDVDFLKYLKKLEKKKPVIFCGDLNVAHTELDLTNPASNRRSHGFTDEERAGFTKIIESGFIDTFREFQKEKGHYTWWSPFNSCRKRNVGWRIDYFLISPALRPRLKKAYILPDVMGSDHCPVAIEIV
jgi:exodeoxyribonuclease III